MEALGLLTADHNRVRGLFSRFKAAEENDDTQTKQQVATKIFEELEVHTTIEEEIFYPSVRGLSDEVDKLVEEGLQEHHVAKTLMEESRGLDPSAPEWSAKLMVLIESVEHHAEEEDSEMFPAIRSSRDGIDLEELGHRLEARKKELGAPTMADKIDLTKDELMQKAQEQEIPGRSEMTKEELAATVDPR